MYSVSPVVQCTQKIKKQIKREHFLLYDTARKTENADTTLKYITLIQFAVMICYQANISASVLA